MQGGYVESVRAWYVESVRAWYVENVKSLVPDFRDVSVSDQEVYFLLRTLDTEYERLGSKGLAVAEFGSGLSTIFVGEWAEDKDGVSVLVMEHSPRWLDVVGELVKRRGIVARGLKLLGREDFVVAALPGQFDVIFVAQGPELVTRIDDLPWTAKLLKASGVLLFDDWRPKYEARVVHALKKLGDWCVACDERTRSTLTGKAIGVARRRSGVRLPFPPPVLGEPLGPEAARRRRRRIRQRLRNARRTP